MVRAEKVSGGVLVLRKVATKLPKATCVRSARMLDDNPDQPGQSSSEQAQPKERLRRMEERERQMEKQPDEIDEHIRRAKEEQKQKIGEQHQES